MTMGFLEDGIDIDTKYVNQSYLIDNFPALISDKMFVTVMSCGRGGQGQLGLTTTLDRNSFQPAPSVTNIKQITGGQYQSFGLKTDGTLIACGYNDYGQLGINSTTSAYSSFQTVPAITNIKQIISVSTCTLGLKTDGTLIACGYSAYSQMGLNNTSKYSSFQTVPAVTNIKQIAGAANQCFGLKKDGTLIACGGNNYGQLGINSSNDQASFQTVPSITNVKQIACSQSHSLGLKTDGTLISCGYNDRGQLGLNVATTSKYSSFQTVPSITNVKQIACGSNHSLGLKIDGSLISCGINNLGQLGLNTVNVNYSSFQTVPSITNIRQIACGMDHTLGLKTDGTVVATGAGAYGQLGINSTAAKSSFQTVPSITNVKQIACGRAHSLLLKTPTNWL